MILGNTQRFCIHEKMSQFIELIVGFVADL